MCAVAPSCMSSRDRSEDAFLMKVVLNQDAYIYIYNIYIYIYNYTIGIKSWSTVLSRDDGIKS